MKPLSSPFENGQLPRRWHHQLFTPWRGYRRALRQQTVDRGEVPADVWGDGKRRRIARTIERLLEAYCWYVPLGFAPCDPWRIVGEWEVGDLSEVEVTMAIERAFHITLPEDLGQRIINGLTFGQLVAMVEERESQPATAPYSEPATRSPRR